MTRAQANTSLPRIVVAGLAGDSGKSLVSLGLVHALGMRGLRVAGFKKGPDFIDAAWLGAASGGAGRNLDTFLMSEAAILGSVARAAGASDVAVVEGNRGLFDGFDAQGTHCTAALAKLLRAPVVLVVDVTKATRTIAALVLGVCTFDPDLELAGVVLNRVGTARHERVIRDAIEQSVGVPVLGALPRWDDVQLPGRHLGLVTPCEHSDVPGMLARLGGLAERHLDVDALLAIAHAAPALPASDASVEAPPSARSDWAGAPRIGVLRDVAFSFYYPENLEALERAGAQLVWIDALEDRALPHIDALYAGGGFPEVHAERLAANEPLRTALRRRIRDGLPVWAECGGLAYLGRSIVVDGQPHDMVGALPIVVEMHAKPQGHGYVESVIDAPNSWLPVGTRLRGHEFHYTGVVGGAQGLGTVARLERGTGVGDHRDAICEGGIIAGYTHLHALGTPEWAGSLVAAARRFAETDPDRDQPSAVHPDAVQAALAAPPPSNAPATDGIRDIGGVAVGGRGGRALAARVRAALAVGNESALELILTSEPRAIRLLLAATYQADSGLRQRAARALGVAGRHHPRAVQSVVRRLVWAMNDESGTNAVNAPETLCAIAEVEPELLLPMLPDLLRLAADDQLREGLAKALRAVSQQCPGRVGDELRKVVEKRSIQGGKGGDATSP